jgi:hypothetical protein
MTDDPGTDLWNRPGGLAGLRADLIKLGATHPLSRSDGIEQYRLPCGRLATLRRKSSSRSAIPLLEIAHSTELGIEVTDLIRYDDR